MKRTWPRSSGTSAAPRIRIGATGKSALIVVLVAHQNRAQLLGDQHQDDAGKKPVKTP